MGFCLYVVFVLFAFKLSKNNAKRQGCFKEEKKDPSFFSPFLLVVNDDNKLKKKTMVFENHQENYRKGG